MATLYTQRSSNITKTWLLMGLFLAVIVGIGYSLSGYYGNPNILYFAVFFSVIMNIGSYWFSDKIALAVSGAKVASKEEYAELHRIVENLAITAGLPKPKVYIIPDNAPNAFATGRNKEHATVAVTTGLLSILDRTELEGVVAHELGHIQNKDILLMSVVAVLVGFISIIADMFLRSAMFGGGRDNDNKGNPLLIIGIIFIILSPIVSTIIQLAISRRREFLADASGALLTRYPEGLANALRKISSYGAPMQKASDATAHLFISNPFGAKKTSGLHKLFMTHPPVEERITALLGMEVKG